MSNTILLFSLIVDKINQINLIVCTLESQLWFMTCIREGEEVTLNVKMSFGMETFVTLINLITKVWHGLGQSVIDDARNELPKHLWVCSHAKRGHFEHLT